MYIRICPRCNSHRTEVDNVLLGRKYRCRSCSFTSSLFPEVDVKNLDALKKMKKGQVKNSRRQAKSRELGISDKITEALRSLVNILYYPLERLT